VRDQQGGQRRPCGLTLTHARLKLFNGKNNIVAGADVVLDDTATQEDVYRHVADVVSSCLLGQNATVLAYGQTSSGKTYSIFGRETLTQPPKYATTGPPRGVVPRAVEALLAGCQGWVTHLSLIYVQLYGERLFDLLQPLPNACEPWARDASEKSAMCGLDIRPLPGGMGVFVAGARRVELTSLEVLDQLLASGAAHRALRATAMNAVSSRSHAIMQIEIRQTHPDTGAQRDSKLNLVDLAGSEKWSAQEMGPDVPPDRVAELCAINSSLSALGACVRALGDPARPHVPYRDSKLTRLLQDCLGGGAQTVLLATLSPSALCFDESASTLRFADAASRMLIAQRNVITTDDADPVAQAAAAKAEVARLLALLRTLTADKQVPSAETADLAAENARLKQELADAKAKAAAATRAAHRAVAEAMKAQAQAQAQAPVGTPPLVPTQKVRVVATRRPMSGGTATLVHSTDQRLSDGWAEPGQRGETTPPSTSSSSRDGSTAPSSRRGTATCRRPGSASTSPEWLTNYANQRKAASAAAAAARAAAADGAHDMRLRRRVAPAAWEAEPLLATRHR